MTLDIRTVSRRPNQSALNALIALVFMGVIVAMIMAGQLQTVFFGLIALAALALVYRRPSIATVVALLVCVTFQRVSTFSLGSFGPISLHQCQTQDSRTMYHVAMAGQPQSPCGRCRYMSPSRRTRRSTFEG